MTEAAVITVINIAFKYGPDAARAVKALFEKEAPTAEDWAAVFSRAKISYDEYVAGKE